MEPSGDQMPFAAAVEISVSCLGTALAGGTVHSCELPERFDSKRILSPSGDQRGGFESFFPWGSVSFFGGVLPSVVAARGPSRSYCSQGPPR